MAAEAGSRWSIFRGTNMQKFMTSWNKTAVLFRSAERGWKGSELAAHTTPHLEQQEGSSLY